MKYITLQAFFLFYCIIWVKTTNAGISWIEQSTPTDKNLEAVCFANLQVGWAVGTNVILKTTDGGNTWEEQDAGGSNFFNDICCIDENTAIVIGNSGLIKKTTDGGATWNALDANTFKYLTGISCKFNKIRIVGDAGTFMESTDGGTTWINKDVGPTDGNKPLLENIIQIDENTIRVSSNLGIHESIDGGDTWTLTPQPDLLSIFFSDKNYGAAVGKSGKILTTTDGGNTWDEKPNSIESENGGNPAPMVGTWYDLNSVYMTDQNTIYVAGNNGLIWKKGANLVNVKETGGKLPSTFALMQNYPNPFNPSTIINFSISDYRYVKLAVYDILGREISVLVSERKPAGNYQVSFDGTGLSNGVYLYRLTAGDFSSTKKLVLLK